LAVDETPAVEEDILDEDEDVDEAVPQNAEHIPMSPTGLPFQKTTSEKSI